MPRYQGTNVGRPQGSVRWTCGLRFVSFRGKQGMGLQAWTFLKVSRYEVSGRHGRRLELQGNFRRSAQGPWRQRYQRYEIRRRRAHRFQNHPVPLQYKGTNFLADRERPGGQHQKIKAVRKVCSYLGSPTARTFAGTKVRLFVGARAQLWLPQRKRTGSQAKVRK